MAGDRGLTGLGRSAGTAPRAPRPPSRDDRPALRPTERRRHLSESAQRDRRRGAIRPATSALALVALGPVSGCPRASAIGPAAAAVPAPPGQGVVEERREEIVLADIDGDGCVSLAELAREMAWRFAALDANHDDVLTPDELGGQDPAKLARPDEDGDGKLTFVEVMQAKEADFARADKA